MGSTTPYGLRYPEYAQGADPKLAVQNLAEDVAPRLHRAEPLTATQITAIATPRIGQLALNTDTGRVQFWNGTVWRPVGGLASGTANLPVLTLSSTFQSLSFFIGMGFEEVQATVAFTAGGFGFGGLINAVADATRATGIGLVTTGSSTPGASTFALTSTTETGVLSVNNNTAATNVYIRNVRLDVDGYLRFELASLSGTVALGTNGTTKMTWRAR